MTQKYKLETAIWYEVANPENPFQADKCFCHGYDVYNDLLVNASWFDYLYLLICGKRPNAEDSILIEKIAIILSNLGIRHLGVRAAMNAGVGKAPAASVLIAALSAGSGQISGAKELTLSMELWQKNINCESFNLSIIEPNEKDIWPTLEHTPGFDPHSLITSKSVLTCLQNLNQYSSGQYVEWLFESKDELEKQVGSPLSLIGVLAAAFCDLNLSIEQSEYLFLILMLPGAAAHAMEQKQLGWRKFPFFSETVSLDDPPPKHELPNIDTLVRGYLNESE